MFYKGKYEKPSAPVAVGSIMMRVACVLLVVVMVSIHMMSGLYAKYTTSGSGEDAARVAKFDVEVIGHAEDIEIDCIEKSEGTYTISVTNKSEVAVRYNLSVVFEGQSEGIEAVFDKDSGILAVGESSDQCELTFTVSDWSKITAGFTGIEDKVTLNFTVTIHVVQVD